jgi:hypothetical protein
MSRKSRTQGVDEVISIGTRWETVPHARIGRLVALIRGALVESHTTGTNRIKGASVKVN